MGCSSSSNIFQSVSDALVWIAAQKFECASVVNVLDDFLFLERSEVLFKIALGSFIRLCELARIPLKTSKTVQPCTKLEFLGLELDSVEKQVRLPESKVSTAITAISTGGHFYSPSVGGIEENGSPDRCRPDRHIGSLPAHRRRHSRRFARYVRTAAG